jgi:dUTP pyrophosphatase
MNALIPTGIYLKLPTGTVGLLTPRSGKAFKSVGFSVANAPGIIDEDFPDEMKVIACNYGNEAIQIDEDERMAQLVVVPYIRCEFEVVDKLSHGEDNERKGGFGHTGAK